MKAPDRDQQADALAAKFRKLSATQRAQLKAVIGDPPDYTKIPESYWKKLQDDAENALLVALIASSVSALWSELDDLEEDLEDDEIESAEEALEEWAAERAAWAAASYRTTTQDRVKRILGRWEAGEDIDPEELDDALDWPFGDGRADGIGTTETTAGGVRGTTEVFNRIPGLVRIWRLGDANHCETCIDLADTEESYWGQFFPDGPPSPHVHCACWLDLKFAA